MVSRVDEDEWVQVPLRLKERVVTDQGREQPKEACQAELRLGWKHRKQWFGEWDSLGERGREASRGMKYDAKGPLDDKHESLQPLSFYGN